MKNRHSILALTALILTALILIISTVFAVWKGLHMIYLPKINKITRERTILTTFGGLDHRAKTPEGYFYDANNLSSDHYPLMATRNRCGRYAYRDNNIDYILESDPVIYAQGLEIYSLDHTVDIVIEDFGATAPIKQLVRMGTYLIILDANGKLFYGNLKDATDSGPVEIPERRIEYIQLYGTDATGQEPTEVAPDSPKEGDMYLSSTYDTIYRYDGFSWVTLSGVKTAISGQGIGRDVKVGDYIYVNLSGEKDLMIEGMYNAYHKVSSVISDDLIVIDYDNKSNYKMSVPLESYLTISNIVPQMDFICSVSNRLWGCRYDGNVNSIYASHLGNFRVFNDFSGTADDSYELPIGLPGEFTGIAAYQGYPIFFKETCIYRIAGTMPENYTAQTTECQGVKKGSYKSVITSEEILYYHGVNGIYAYDGNLPQKISYELGNDNFSDAVAGYHRNKLYINMRSSSGVYATYVYDLSYGVWHKQDEGVKIYGFASYDTEMYFVPELDVDVYNEIHTVGGSKSDSLPQTDLVKWYAETGIIGTDSPESKYLARMLIRMSMELGATMTIYVEYDSIPEWIPITTISGDSLKSFSVPLTFDKCDHLRLRFEGEGECKIYTITKDIEKGGEAR